MRNRRRKIGLALATALVAALGFYRWTGSGEPPTARPPLAGPAPRETVSGKEPLHPAVHPSSLPSPRHARDPSSQPLPTPSVFDFATLAGSGATRQGRGEERFRTNEWFTAEDLQHPERYFELAQRMPELNRPEERHDTLDYFLAYREKLKRDLDAVGDNSERRREILAVIERYDSAITRLRKLVNTEEAK